MQTFEPVGVCDVSFVQVSFARGSVARWRPGMLLTVSRPNTKKDLLSVENRDISGVLYEIRFDCWAILATRDRRATGVWYLESMAPKEQSDAAAVALLAHFRASASSGVGT